MWPRTLYSCMQGCCAGSLEVWQQTACKAVLRAPAQQADLQAETLRTIRSSTLGGVKWVTACRGERYMEVDIDVASSSVASTVVGMVQVSVSRLKVEGTGPWPQ